MRTLLIVNLIFILVRILSTIKTKFGVTGHLWRNKFPKSRVFHTNYKNTNYQKKLQTILTNLAVSSPHGEPLDMIKILFL